MEILIGIFIVWWLLKKLFARAIVDPDTREARPWVERRIKKGIEEGWLR